MLRTLTNAIGTNATNATGTSSGATLSNTSTTAIDVNAVVIKRDESPHHLPGVGVGVLAGEPDPVVEGRILERLEFDGGGHLEELVHRPPVDEFGGEDAQFGEPGGDERRRHQRHAEQDEPRHQLRRGDVAVVDEQVDQFAPDEQLRCGQHRTEHGESEREPQLPGRSGVDQFDGEPNRRQRSSPAWGGAGRPGPRRRAPLQDVTRRAHASSTDAWRSST